jgi:hypothetical protein
MPEPESPAKISITVKCMSQCGGQSSIFRVGDVALSCHRFLCSFSKFNRWKLKEKNREMGGLLPECTGWPLISF